VLRVNVILSQMNWGSDPRFLAVVRFCSNPLSQERSIDLVSRLHSSQTFEHYFAWTGKFEKSFIPLSVNNYQYASILSSVFILPSLTIFYLHILSDILCNNLCDYYARKQLCFQRVLAIAILSVRLSVCHTGGSSKNGPS